MVGVETNLKPLCCCWNAEIHALLVFFFSLQAAAEIFTTAAHLQQQRGNCVTSCSETQVRKTPQLTELVTAVSTEQSFKC